MRDIQLGKLQFKFAQLLRGSLQYIKSDLWGGIIPSKLIMGIVSENAQMGDFTGKIHSFSTTTTLSKVSVKVGNSDVPGDPVDVNVLRFASYLEGNE